MALDFNRGKYCRHPLRAKWWNWYEGIYFVTIHTQNRYRHYFGEIQWDPQKHKNVMVHSEIGKFADEEIPKIMEHHPHAYIPSWVVMPDHIHMIIMISVIHDESNESNESNNHGTVRPARCHSEINDLNNSNEFDNSNNHDGTVQSARCHGFDNSNNFDDIYQSIVSIKSNDLSKRMSQIAPKHGQLAVVINQFKRAVTIYARKHGLPFLWQSRYWGIILKDQQGFERVRRYIDNNIAKWDKNKKTK